jgi:hypothetical protein
MINMAISPETENKRQKKMKDEKGKAVTVKLKQKDYTKLRVRAIVRGANVAETAEDLIQKGLEPKDTELEKLYGK